MRDHLPALLILSPLAGAWLTLTFSFFSHRLSRWVTILTLLVTLKVVWDCLARFSTQGDWHYSLGGWAPPWGIEMVVTPFSTFFAFLMIVIALFSSYYLGTHGLLAGLPRVRESLGDTLSLLLTMGLMGLLWVRDGFTFYLLLQFSILAAMAWMACLVRQAGTGIFYFLLAGSTGASLLVAGFLFLYAGTGTLNLGDILAQLFIFKNFALASVAGALFTVGWVPLLLFPSPRFFGNLSDQTSPYLLGFLSSAFVRVGVFALFLLYFFVLDVPGLSQPWGLVVMEYLLIYALFFEFLSAARQKDFLHMAGFLSLAQIGYIFSGFALGNKSALTGALMELLTQLLTTAGFFFIAGTLRTGAGALPFSRLVGLARYRPLTGLALVIFAAAIVGIPPTGGFFGKWYLVLGAVAKKDWIILAGILVSVAFNFVYFFKLTLFLYGHRSPHPTPPPVSLVFKSPILLLALGVLLLGIFHDKIIHDFIEPALPRAFQNLPVPNVPFLGKQVE